MIKTDEKKTSLLQVFSTVILTFISQPRILIPFLIFTGLELMAIFVLFLAPRMPLRLIFASPIQTFWGEGYLHYPANFLLLPKLSSLARMALSVFFSSLLTGVSIHAYAEYCRSKKVRLANSLKVALRKYASLVCMVALVTIIFYICSKLITILLARYFLGGHTKLLFIPAGIWMGPLQTVFNMAAAMLIQSAFIYALPYIVIDDVRLVKSIFYSLLLCKKMFLRTILLVGLPMLLYLPTIVLTSQSVFLINNLFPESILLVLLGGAIVSSCIIDPLSTISITHVFLNQKKNHTS
jgi:hypothetical protein